MITLYDIASCTGKAYFPNSWKTRYCLNYKGLAHQTAWLEMPDIEAASKEVGILPSGKMFGKDNYTTPAIVDSDTGAALADSVLIAEYLDNAYPNTPKLFPPGTEALQLGFIDGFMSKLTPTVWAFTLSATNDLLNPPSQKYFRRTREEAIGQTIEEVTPTGDKAVEEWDKVKAGLTTIDGWLQKGKDDGAFFLGQEPVFADFVVASFLSYIKYVLGEDSRNWKEIEELNEGRWVAWLGKLEKYASVF